MTCSTRAEARSTGAATFFTGHPCKHGHVAGRSAATGACVVCKRESSLGWHARHPEKSVFIRNRWRQANRERERTGCKAWRAKNLEKELIRVRETVRQWAKLNPERAAYHKRRAKAVRRGAKGSHTQADISEILKSQHRRCAYCRAKLKAYHVDHIVAIARGGTDDRHNLQVLCPPCNLRKHARDPIEFAQSMGMLL